MNILQLDVKRDGRQIKQSFTGTYRTTVIMQGQTLRKTTTPIVKTSGQIVYTALIDTKDAAPLNILADRRLPQVGDVYAENGVLLNGVYYSDATPRFIGPRGTFYEWEINYTIGGEFSNAAQTSGGSQNDEESQPETLLTFSTSIELEDYATASDLDGAWNCNSIGEFFADPLIVKTGILNLNYSRRERENPLSLVRDYFQAINASTFWGFPAGSLKISDISFNATQTTDETTYDVTYKIQYRPRGWSVEKANAGFYYMTAAGVVRALNDDGSPTDQPVLLALDGSRLPAGAAVPLKKFRVNQTADFSALGLPNPFEV